MDYLIISSHPYEGSFNYAVVNNLKNHLADKGHAISVIDLVKDGFNPVMTKEDLKQWGSGQIEDELIKKYQEKIKNAETLIFPFPIWWGSMPAVLKGFCDKVFLQGFAYKYNESGQMQGILTDKKAVVITTMETPLEVYNGMFNSPVENAFIKVTLQTCGIEVINYLQVDKIVSGGRENAETKMKEILNLF